MNTEESARSTSVTGRKTLVALIWAGLFVLGLLGLWKRIQTGHLLAGYGSYMPWGLWVALYFHGVGLAAGAFAVAAGEYLLDVPAFQRKGTLRTAIVLSMAAMLPALLAISLDLGHFDRAHFVFLSPSFTSVMTVNTWLYQTFIVVALIVWLLSWKRQSAWLKAWLMLGIALCLAFAAGSGLFFGAVAVKPHWYGTIWPVVTLVSALTAGSALLLCVQNGDAALILRRIVMTGLLVYFGIEACQWLVDKWYTGTDTLCLTAGMEYPEHAWIHYVVGGVLPLLLLLFSWRTGWRLAALLVAVAFVSGRLNLLLPGEPPAELPALVSAFQHERLVFAYHPTPMEVQVGLLLVALGMAIYFIGGKINGAVASRFLVADQGDKQ